MKVAALGGCGGMGRYAVRTAADYDFVDEIVVADVDLERAKVFAASVAPKAHAVAVDATDDASLDAAIAGCDVVLNTVGPFYRFGVPILRAAIRGGACYLDINDDWEPTLDMLELAPEARDARVTAVVGLGASPGVSNLLALKAMEGFDNVERIVTGWSFGYSDRVLSDAQEDRTSAALVHWLHQCSGTIRVFRDPQPRRCQTPRRLSVDYPGIGVACVDCRTPRSGHVASQSSGRFQRERDGWFLVRHRDPAPTRSRHRRRESQCRRRCRADDVDRAPGQRDRRRPSIRALPPNVRSCQRRPRRPCGASGCDGRRDARGRDGGCDRRAARLRARRTGGRALGSTGRLQPRRDHRPRHVPVRGRPALPAGAHRERTRPHLRLR